MEILFTILYTLFIGFYNVFKKQSIKKSNEHTVLVMFTTVAFLCSLIWIPFGLDITIEFVLIFALKGFLLALSWLIILKILKDVDLSLVSIMNVLSSVMSFILGIIIFNETTSVLQIIGSLIIILCVAGINIVNKDKKGKISLTHTALLILSACITTASNIIDKYTTIHLSSFQVQFWFLLFVCVFSWIFYAIVRFKDNSLSIAKKDFKNLWIYLIGIFLFIGDFWLFQAYKVPGSKMITISILSKLKIVVSVLAGIIIFKEKNIIKKLILTILIVIGAILISL
ncbi:MAG: DMT family transporter [Clostridia bacterium]|nr:DMT family transporter [Clostridia bacterium]